MEEHLAILVAPDKTDRQAAPELAAFCLIANAAVETRAQHVKLGFTHCAFETEQQAIVEERGMINAVGIANERVGQAGKVDETVPIGVIAGEPRASRPSTRPTRASATSAVRRAKPDRATEPQPERPRSSSMTTIRSSGQPSSRALVASAY